MRTKIIIFCLTLSTVELFAQRENDSSDVFNKAILSIQREYFSRIEDYVVLHTCEGQDRSTNEWYSCLVLEENQNIIQDSTNLILVRFGTHNGASAFMFIRLVEVFQYSSSNNELIEFNFNTDFLMIVEFEISDAGVILKESDTHLEPY